MGMRGDQKGAGGVWSSMANTVQAALKYSNGATQAVWLQLKGTPFEAKPRTTLVSAYIAIALEHQEAITRLVAMNLYAPALALLRLELEAVFRGLWVNLIADDKQVIAIGQEGEEPFPRPFEKFANELEARYHTDGWLLSFVDKWKSLNGYTHGGLEQLGRRFRPDGNIASSYPDDIVTELVTASGTLLIMMVVPIFRSMGFEEKAKALEKWIEEN
jgi:hypothetical protein